MITVEKWAALKHAMRHVEYKRRLERLAQPPETPDSAALKAWREALRRDSSGDPYERRPAPSGYSNVRIRHKEAP